MNERSVRHALAGYVHSRLLAGGPTGIRRRALLGLRALLISHGDPSVRFELGGLPLILPLSHDLPLLRALFPRYSENLARLTSAVAAKYSDLAAVDIGANVGDSVALIRSAASIPILCVEGDPGYLGFLRVNTASLPEVSIAPVFVAATSGDLAASFRTARGSGHLEIEGQSGRGVDAVPALSLDSLLARHRLDGRLKLLKSDTDGFEGQILSAGVSSLAKHRPVVFFEYAPDLLARNGTTGLELLAMLHDAGYTNALLYDNVGDLLLTCRLDERRHLEEVDGYFTGWGPERYLDIAVFHDEDADVFESFRDRELELFRTVRGRSDS